MSSSDSRTVAIVGAGIVGVSAAIWLRRAGFDVTLVDRAVSGGTGSTSSGNAGILAACSVAPVTAPGMVRKSPGMLMDQDFPLFLRWSYLPRLMPWLLKYLSHANDEDTRRIAKGLGGLTSDSVAQHAALCEGTDASEWLLGADYSFVYPTRAAFEADAYTWKLRHDAGFDPEILEGPAVRERHPSLTDSVNCLAVMHDHGFVRDPARYVAALAHEAEKLGTKMVRAEVEDFELTDGRITALLTTAGTITCSQAILATGVWSGSMTKKLGLNVPIESERGYHIDFKSARNGPESPLMVTSGKFVATPMKGFLRCAGVVEFGGLQASASEAPLNLLRKKVKETFPDLEYESEETWLGHRPAPSDSLPLIGEIGATGIYAGFGHHHIGLTAGPKTGRILSELISGQVPHTDLNPYSPARF